MSKSGGDYAISCEPDYGPIFGNCDIRISSNCTSEDSCTISNDGTHGYECHPQLKSSLFVNTAGPDNENKFTVLDYEVFTSSPNSPYPMSL